jgi:putative Mg2+ transporter-C (MgtC) family protein
MLTDSLASPTSTGELLVRLVLAAACGAAIGLNRELQEKPAGLRTHALVSLGAALLTIVGLLLGAGDPGATGRVLQGIVSGIGFIGAGVILHRDDSKGVHGLTTAAAIWIVAAVGIAVGAGLWRIALVVVALVLLLLSGGEYVDRWLHERLRSR